MKRYTIHCRAHDTSNNPISELQFTIDNPVPDTKKPDILSIRGWVVHKTQNITRVTVESKAKKSIGEAPVNIHRPGVNKRFRKYCNPEKTGFVIDLDTPLPGVYSLVAHSDTGERQPVCELSIKISTQRKMLFMHIAKAGGSSVNMFAVGNFSEEKVATHIESNEKWFRDSDYREGLSFISGHVNLERLRKHLNLKNYYRVTVVREPYSHVISHLAWIRKLSDQGEESRLQKHPPYIQSFSKKLLHTDLADPVEISQFVNSLSDQEKQLVDNCQVRYFTRTKMGERISPEHARLAVKATGMFDRIGLTENLQQFFNDVSHDMNWQGQKPNISENVSSSYYGMTRSNASICTALLPLVKHDIVLYDFIKAHNGIG